MIEFLRGNSKSRICPGWNTSGKAVKEFLNNAVLSTFVREMIVLGTWSSFPTAKDFIDRNMTVLQRTEE
jgi:hypothetical protein